MAHCEEPHAPFWHCPELHTCPHFPQLSGSDRTSAVQVGVAEDEVVVVVEVKVIVTVEFFNRVRNGGFMEATNLPTQ